MRLDRDRPFGEIHGDPRLAFEQDGLLFDRQGNRVLSDRPPSRKRKLKTWTREAIRAILYKEDEHVAA